VAKLKEFRITHGGVQYVFVTRGRARPFTAREVTEYLKEEAAAIDSAVDTVSRQLHEILIPKPGIEVEDDVKEQIYDGAQLVESWQIPDDKMRRHMFRKDLQEGMEFCTKKYGQPESVIKAEAKRLASGGF